MVFDSSWSFSYLKSRKSCITNDVLPGLPEGNLTMYWTSAKLVMFKLSLPNTFSEHSNS